MLDFWHEFASTYSFLTAVRIETAAAEAGVAVAWRPFLLGPIFAAQGWRTSPFTLYPDKGAYMWRDVEREAERLGYRLRPVATFPQNGLLAARVALVGSGGGWQSAFTKAVYLAEFCQARAIAEPAVLGEILSDLGQDPRAVLEAAAAPEVKARLRAQTQRAQELRIFGAPSFVTGGGELFWGNDRLEQALAWEAAGRRTAEA